MLASALNFLPKQTSETKTRRWWNTSKNNWPNGKRIDSTRTTITMRPTPRRNTCRQRRRHCCRYLSIYASDRRTDPRKCCPIKCWMESPRWTWASRRKYEILRRPKRPRRNFSWNRRTRKMPLHTSCPQTWPSTSSNTIDVNIQHSPYRCDNFLISFFSRACFSQHRRLGTEATTTAPTRAAKRGEGPTEAHWHQAGHRRLPLR